MGATHARAFVRTRIVAKADMLLLEKSAEKAELLRLKILVPSFQNLRSAFRRQTLLS